MKLLIVDDETITRTGLSQSINWRELGIDEVYMAEDGAEGLHAASLHRPDLILSDVRMPRMTGIEMLERVKAFLPDTIFIFMSGYSDKEYLKAAIRLHAVSYVEKPLDLQEIRDAVTEAVSRRRLLSRNQSAEQISSSVSAGRLAAYLTSPPDSASESIRELSRDYCQKYGDPDIFRSAVTLLLSVDERTELDPGFLSGLEDRFLASVRPLHFHVISTEKRPNLFVLHLFRRDPITEQSIRIAADQLKKILEPSIAFYLTYGPVVSGIHRLYDSYCSAVIALQHAFFFPPASLRGPLGPSDPWEETVNPPLPIDQIRLLASRIEEAIRTPDRDRLQTMMNELHLAVSCNPTLLYKSIHNIYYRLISAIMDQRRKKQLPGAGILHSSDMILDSLDRCFSYEELHGLLDQTLLQYMDELDSYVPENSSVFLIKQYIQDHYGNPMLSTKEISQYAALSASYACTVFKNETGQTLNQYLTDFRLERAKELLSDPRINISEVASRVGYNDSNYFGKAFKKHTGLSPSEFRESRPA